jgi:hypothetical protein
MIAVAFAVLLQALSVASMPVMAVSQDDQMVVICTGSGMKVVPLIELGIDFEIEQDLPAAMHTDGMCAFCMAGHPIVMVPSWVYVPAVDLDAHAPQAPPLERLVAQGFRPLPQVRAPPSHI